MADDKLLNLEVQWNIRPDIKDVSQFSPAAIA